MPTLRRAAGHRPTSYPADMVHPQPLPVVQTHRRGGGRAGQVVVTVLGVLLVVVCAVVISVVAAAEPRARSVLDGAAGRLAARAPPGGGVRAGWTGTSPSRAGLLLFAFAWGATVATVGSLLLSLPPTLAVQAAGGDADVVGAVVVAPLVEETLKGLGLLAVVLVGRRALDGLVDGIVYAGLVGLGFAFTENVLYLGTALLDGGEEGLVTTFVLRGVLSPFAHPLFTAATGAGLVAASRARGAVPRGLLALLGLAAAVVLHGVWNLLAVGGTGPFLESYVGRWVPLFVAFVVIAVGARSRQARTIRSGVALYARHGWLTPAEEQSLLTLPARRRALRAARRAGAGGAERRFQGAAVDLAHLRARMEAGTAPWDAPARERDLLDRLAGARARLGGVPATGPGRS